MQNSVEQYDAGTNAGFKLKLSSFLAIHDMLSTNFYGTFVQQPAGSRSTASTLHKPRLEARVNLMCTLSPCAPQPYEECNPGQL